MDADTERTGKYLQRVMSKGHPSLSDIPAIENPSKTYEPATAR